jgi:hypothetical protein
MSDSKTPRKKATNLLKNATFIDDVWLVALYLDGSELKILIPNDYQVPIQRSAEVKLISITNGVDTVPAMKGPLYCGHHGCKRKNCSGTLRGITSELIELMREVPK